MDKVDELYNVAYRLAKAGEETRRERRLRERKERKKQKNKALYL